MKVIIGDEVGPLSRDGFAKFLEIGWFNRFQIFTNNYCNLHCEQCTSLGHVPIHPDSEYPFCRQRYDIDIEDVVQFCELFKEIGRPNYHRLLGGETTAMPTTDLEEIIEVLASYDRKIWLLTNGYGVMNITKKMVNEVHKITFDDHGINHDHIQDCIKHLKPFYKGDVHIITYDVHYNLSEARNHPDNRGVNCLLWIHIPILYKSIIYPCCNLPFIEGWNRNTKMGEKLTDAGWSIYNPNIKQVLKNWRNTIPKYVWRQCRRRCWMPNTKLGTPYKIKLKPNDVIRRMIV